MLYKPAPRRSPVARSTVSIGCRFLAKKRSPFGHQRSPLLKHVAALICPFGIVADHVRQRRFGDLARGRRSLRGPSAERSAKAMHGETDALHALKDGHH